MYSISDGASFRSFFFSPDFRKSKVYSLERNRLTEHCIFMHMAKMSETPNVQTANETRSIIGGGFILCACSCVQKAISLRFLYLVMMHVEKEIAREREHERVCSVNLLELESYIGHFFYAIDDGNGETSNQTNIKYLHL